MASSFKSPADTAKACVGIAELKDKAPMSNLILLSFLAGHILLLEDSWPKLLQVVWQLQVIL